MIQLIRREWKRWRKNLLSDLAFRILTLFLVLVICILKRNELQFYLIKFFDLPEAITAFSGYDSWNGMGNTSYYILFAMMFINVSIIWKACKRTLRIVYMDENNQSVCSICNQLCSRQKLVVSKYLWAIISSLVSYVILSICMCVMIKIGNAVAKQGTDFNILILLRTYGAEIFGSAYTDWNMLAMQIVKVLIVQLMLVSLTFLYAVWTRNAYQMKYGFITFLVFGTFILGNLYKLRDILYWAMREAEISIGKIEEVTLWMDKLFWISPLSWLNPRVQMPIVFMVTCIGVSIFALFMGILGYKRRTL